VITFDRAKYEIIDLFTVTTIFAASREFLVTQNLDTDVSLDTILKYPLITRPEIIAHIGFSAKIIKTTSSKITLEMTKNHIGIGIFSDRFFKTVQDPNLIILNVQNFKYPIAKIGLAHPKPLSPHAKIFVSEFLKSIVK
jgi:hypothetical protein